MRYETIKGKNGKWYWRLRSRNGQITAVGGEPYSSKHNTDVSIERHYKAIKKCKKLVIVNLVKK